LRSGSISLLFSLALAASAFSAADAEDPPAKAEDTPAKATSVTVYGDDPCPQTTPDEIVICARRPEHERYRIPKEFRKKKEDAPSERSWADRLRSMDDVTAFSRPNSCSVVGTYGQSGCWDQMLRQWRAQRREMTKEVEPAP